MAEQNWCAYSRLPKLRKQDPTLQGTKWDSAFLSSLTAAQCLFCAGQERAVKEYFDALFYEMIHAWETQKSIREAWGVCPHHASHLAQYEGALGGTIVVQDVLTTLCSYSSPEKAPAPCPVCILEDEVTQRYKRYLRAVARSETTMQITVCWSHFKTTVTDIKMSKSFRQSLWNQQKKMWMTWLGSFSDATSLDSQDLEAGRAWQEVLEYWSDRLLVATSNDDDVVSGGS